MKNKLVFNYKYNSLRDEYEIWIVNDLFCHIVGEVDFQIFKKLVIASGHEWMMRIS